MRRFSQDSSRESRLVRSSNLRRETHDARVCWPHEMASGTSAHWMGARVMSDRSHLIDEADLAAAVPKRFNGKPSADADNPPAARPSGRSAHLRRHAGVRRSVRCRRPACAITPSCSSLSLPPSAAPQGRLPLNPPDRHPSPRPPPLSCRGTPTRWLRVRDGARGARHRRAVSADARMGAPVPHRRHHLARLLRAVCCDARLRRHAPVPHAVAMSGDRSGLFGLAVSHPGRDFPLHRSWVGPPPG